MSATERDDCFNLGRLLNTGYSAIIAFVYQTCWARDCESVAYNTDTGANLCAVKLTARELGKIVC
jgi:hypothetical protein